MRILTYAANSLFFGFCLGVEDRHFFITLGVKNTYIFYLLFSDLTLFFRFEFVIRVQTSLDLFVPCNSSLY